MRNDIIIKLKAFEMLLLRLFFISVLLGIINFFLFCYFSFSFSHIFGFVHDFSISIFFFFLFFLNFDCLYFIFWILIKAFLDIPLILVKSFWRSVHAECCYFNLTVCVRFRIWMKWNECAQCTRFTHSTYNQFFFFLCFIIFDSQII